MNRPIKIFLLLIILATLIYWAMSSKLWSNIKSDGKDFAVADTASVTKLFLANKRSQQVTLEKNEAGIWMVNREVVADIQKINLIKATLHDLKVRNPLSESEFNTVVSRLASDAVKTEVYAGKKLIKTVYIGQATAEGTGTYMMLENASTPYVIHIPGFIGYLSPRFSANPIKWKDKRIFNFKAEEIHSIQVNYPTNPVLSFKVTNGTVPEVFDINEKPVMADLNFVKYYLASFHQLSIEAYDEDIPQVQVDSIRNTTPFCIVTLTTKQNTSRKLTVHLKGIDKRTKERYNEEGKELEYDYDKYFGFVDNEKEVVYVQQYNFGRVFKTIHDFKTQP
ncbi:MAG: DUF4340 domain-containing protein [Bacteroidia bacterium]|jgi:hypothetical protein